ncbi:alpha/beta hydrolase [Actinoplanes sp. NPDC048988]|uniref:alpha/beta hydrolase n=1 Tax=Actinoplanes sp. NPDC048988 TaxID=3363901 RepID=UPI0037226610
MRPLDDISFFAMAVQAASAVVAADTADAAVRPESRSALLSHGDRTARAVLLLHGYTHGPQQMDALARDFHARGYNVWIPRMPNHGTNDPQASHRGSVRDLISYASKGLDIAAGLGDEIGVVGISAGGILAAWLAQHRDDVVRRLLLLSPFFGPASPKLPGPAVRLLSFGYARGLLPDRRTSRGYSLAAVGRYLSIAQTLRTPPRPSGLRSIAMAISSLDDVVDTGAATSIPRRMAEAAGIPLHALALPEALGIGHNTLALAGRPDAGELLTRYVRLYEGMAAASRGDA